MKKLMEKIEGRPGVKSEAFGRDFSKEVEDAIHLSVKLESALEEISVDLMDDIPGMPPMDRNEKFAVVARARRIMAEIESVTIWLSAVKESIYRGEWKPGQRAGFNK